ncbi:MAG: RNA polymerase sigma factor [Anaerolineae bacterium]|jgi:RNA polymerase sigma-70 factor (ECF subfamily)
MMDEVAWIQQAQQGDMDAFARLVQLYQTPVYNLAYRMLGERMEAEDAAQETFLRAFRHLSRYDPARPFRNWLLSITAHYCVDRLRRRRPLLALDDEIATGGGADPGDAVVAWEARERIQRFLLRLPAEDRAAVTLRYWYDCSYEEMAQILGTTVSAVKSRLHRARLALARMVEESKE